MSYWKADRQAIFTSLSDKWNTPSTLYNQLNLEFKFDFDPCPKNATFDGLSIEWGKSNFVNPPYGRKYPLWVEKGVQEAKKGKSIVFLLASRTDTKVFHEWILPYAKEIRFIKGRLRFVNDDGSTGRATFPSMIVIF